MKRHDFSFTLFAAWLCSVPLAADDGVFDQYRDLMGDDNPAVFVIDEGEELWFTPQGPESATLEACDLGLGPGVTAGAYVRFPRYFADTDAVMDLESRLVHCMTAIQGRGLEAGAAQPSPPADDKTRRVVVTHQIPILIKYTVSRRRRY